MSYMLRKLLARVQEEETGGEGSTGGEVAAPESTAEVAEPAEESTESSVNWNELEDELEVMDNEVEGDAEILGEEKAPEVKELEKIPVPAEPAAEVPAPVAEPVPVPDTPTTATVESPRVSTEEYQTWRGTRLTQLEQEYALEEADATALITEPETVLPKLAARVHMEVLESSMRAMQAMVPVMMQQITQSTEQNSRAKNLFTSINPDLADPKYEPAIMQLGQVFRNVNRTATAEEASRAIGNLVRSALNITQPAPVAASPAAPVMQAPTPFTPARGGGSGGGGNAMPTNEFEKLAMEFLRED